MRGTGLALLDGRGVTKDPEQGLKWLHRAAVCGDPAAQKALQVNGSASF
jgi:TPR repeat protein